MYCCNFQYNLIKNMEYKLNRKNNRVHIDYLSKHELICPSANFSSILTVIKIVLKKMKKKNKL